jgi:two-component system response regulator DesR
VEVLVVDAHAPSRLGMSVLLQREPWVERCLLAADMYEAVALARRHGPGVALLDTAFVASPLLEAHPALRILLTSRCSRIPVAPPRALGAVGFVGPDAAGEEIVAAARRAATEPALAPVPPAIRLSERDRSLLALIGTGATNREIAERLYLSPDGVKKSASALYRKLGVRNRTEAAQRAAGL